MKLLSSDGPDGLEVSPESFREAVLQGIRNCNAKLVKLGYAALSEDADLRVEVRTDGVMRNGHKQVYVEKAGYKNGAWYGLWVGGMARSNGWWVVEDVKPSGTIGRHEHEAAHVLLSNAGVSDTKQHDVMKKAKVYGS